MGNIWLEKKVKKKNEKKKEEESRQFSNSILPRRESV
jgi:hypothetical protein